MRADCVFSAYTACCSKIRSAEQPSDNLLTQTNAPFLNHVQQAKHGTYAQTSILGEKRRDCLLVRVFRRATDASWFREVYSVHVPSFM